MSFIQLQLTNSTELFENLSLTSDNKNVKGFNEIEQLKPNQQLIEHIHINFKNSLDPVNANKCIRWF